MEQGVFSGETKLGIAVTVLGVAASLFIMRMAYLNIKVANLTLEKLNAEKANLVGKTDLSSSMDGVVTNNSMVEYDTKLIKSLGQLDIPDGTFKGEMSGYMVTLKDKKGLLFSFKTNNGVRGIHIPAIVTVLNNIAFVKI